MMDQQGRRLLRGNKPVRLLLAACLVVTVASCMDTDGDLAMGEGELVTYSGAVKTNQCPDGPTVYGIDVSKWQGNIGWAAVKTSGVKYAFIRVSDGTGYIDEKFEQNWAGAKAQGIPHGVYQFFRSNQNPITQANILIDKLNANGPGTLPPVIDVETTDGQTPATMITKIGQWINHVEAATGQTPIIYTGSYFWEANVNSSAFTSNPLWTPHWGATCPTMAGQWDDWLFWQYSDSGSVSGISGGVDQNNFNGNLAALNALTSDPECANPNYSACSGNAVATCDNAGKVQTSGCGLGASCSTQGGMAHCVDDLCTTNLGGAETGKYCVNDNTLVSCAQGALTQTNCSNNGKKCSDAGATARCIDAECWDNLGGQAAGTFCVDGQTLGSCTNGTYTQSNCQADYSCTFAGGPGCTLDPVEPEPDTFEPDTFEPDTFEPDTFEQDTLPEPDAVAVDTGEPSVDTSATSDTLTTSDTTAGVDTAGPVDTSSPDDTGGTDAAPSPFATAGPANRDSESFIYERGGGCAASPATSLPALVLWTSLTAVAVAWRRRRLRQRANGGSY